MAADRGVTVRTVDIRPDDVTLDLEDLESKLSSKTKLVAVGYASNAVGTVNPVARDRRPRPRGRRDDLRRRGRLRARTGRSTSRRSTRTSWLLRLQVVRAPPRRAVRQGRASSIACRPSRSGPPMIGSRPGRVIRVDRGDARCDRLPAGRRAGYGDVRGAPGAPNASERRRELVAGMTAIAAYERELVTRLIDGLRPSRGMTIHGITDAPFRARVPTVSVSIEGVHPRAAAEALAARESTPGTATSTRPASSNGSARPTAAACSGWAGPLQHRGRGGPDARGAGADRPVVRNMTGGPRSGADWPEVRPGRAAPDQAAVGAPFDRRGRARHRRPHRDAVRGLRLRDRPHRPALGGPCRRPSLLHGAVRGVP